jgi:hypothetical protein
MTAKRVTKKSATNKRVTKKSATNKRATAGRAKNSGGVASLFLETSAQVLRITGSEELRLGIDEVIDRAGRVATSWSVRREFEQTLLKTYDTVAEKFAELSYPDQRREFDEMWHTVSEKVSSPYEQGRSFLPYLNSALGRKYGRRRISPRIVQTYVEGLKEFAEQNFLQPILFDKSSCNVWFKPRGECPCHPEPGPTCRLKKICVGMRDDFIASAETLAEAGREESPWLKANLAQLRTARGKSLLSILGKHPGHVGDLVIFWEVLDRWLIFTRDHTFQILKGVHRDKKVRVFKVRRLRKEGGEWCKVQRPATGEAVEGVLVNRNDNGVRIRAPLSTVRKHQKVTVKAPVLGSRARDGEVAYVVADDPSVFAVRFISKRS